MIIDERLIANGITETLLANLIRRHEMQRARYEKLKDYYIGKHAIINRKMSSSGVANNKIVCNHAKYIVDTTVSYLVGNDVTYAVSEGYDIEALKSAYLEQDIHKVDYKIGKLLSIYGRAYELVYMNADSQPRSVTIEPTQAFVVYNDDCTHIPLFGVYYYKTRDIDGNVSGVVCNVYTDSEIFTYENTADMWESMKLTATERHYLGDVPLIEYINNDECQGDFEQVISQIDAYNTHQSDRVNDKENFVDSFLFLKGIEIDTEQAKKLRQEKILICTDGIGDAKYLSKVLSETDMRVMRDDLKEDIHRLSLTPDLSDESFGNNLSGVAIKYKIMAFENHVKDKEGYFKTGLKKRFVLYNHILALKNAMEFVPIHRVDVIFTHNLPANDFETSQTINNLAGKVSNETLISQLGFVSDAKEEAELAKEEVINAAVEAFKRKTMENQMLSEGGGY